jgi:hypothetical protein
LRKTKSEESDFLTQYKGNLHMAELFAALDLTTVVAFVVATGLLIVGISLAEKGIGITKRNVKKA